MLDKLNDPIVRHYVFKDSFPLFFAYHYWRVFTDFQNDRMKSLSSLVNVFIVGFRASRKTTIARGFIVWCVAYKKFSYIIWQSYESEFSGASVREIAKMMNKKSITQDYGELYPFESKNRDMKKASLTNFETTNWVKVQSRSLKQTSRGANTYDDEAEMSARPELLVLDDIDVIDSVTNVAIINKNEKKLTTETIPALDPLKRMVILLGNVIFEDGIVPRFWDLYKQSITWNCYWQPLFTPAWENVRPTVFTDVVITELKADWKISYNQNYLLIPDSAGSGIFVEEYFDWFLQSHFEMSDGILKKQDLNIWLFVDPAFSWRQWSDDAVCIWWSQHTVSKSFYVIDWYAWIGATSKTITAIIKMYNTMSMDWFAPKFVSVEDVSINKEQTKFIKDLKEDLIYHEINIPVYSYVTKVKKEDRIKFNLEPVMSQQGMKFNRNISQASFIPKMKRQFTEFPNAQHDDTIDTLAQMVDVFRRWVWKAKKPQIKKTYRSGITNEEVKPNYRKQYEQQRSARRSSFL